MDTGTSYHVSTTPYAETEFASLNVALCEWRARIMGHIANGWTLEKVTRERVADSGATPDGRPTGYRLIVLIAHLTMPYGSRNQSRRVGTIKCYAIRATWLRAAS